MAVSNLALSALVNFIFLHSATSVINSRINSFLEFLCCLCIDVRYLRLPSEGCASCTDTSIICVAKSFIRFMFSSIFLVSHHLKADLQTSVHTKQLAFMS